MKKSIIYNLSPFNNETNMSGVEYIIKRLFAFVLIYGVSAVLGEGIIIGLLYGMGYDPLHGIMPEGQISELLLYYGFVIFSIITLLYCKFVEKKNIKSIGFSGNPIEYLTGALIASILLVVIIGIGCIFDSIAFCGFNTNVNVKSLLLWILAFGIQGATEEIMCRGFLLNSLKKRISIPLAILISSTAFVFPHMSSLLEANFVYAMVGITNLYLISVIFSILVLWRSNIWIACGLHSVWNFILYVIMGLSLSGSESISKGVILFNVKDTSILNGAEYGIEASVITTLVLGVLLFVMAKRWKGRIDNMEKLIAISDLFKISLDELVMDKAPVRVGEVSAKSEIVNELKEKVLTDENKQKAKRGLKIAAIVFGIILLLDVISMIIYFSLYGFPQ